MTLYVKATKTVTEETREPINGDWLARRFSYLPTSLQSAVGTVLASDHALTRKRLALLTEAVEVVLRETTEKQAQPAHKFTIGPVNGFQGLMRIQETIERMGMVKSASVYAYTGGRATLLVESMPDKMAVEGADIVAALMPLYNGGGFAVTVHA